MLKRNSQNRQSRPEQEERSKQAEEAKQAEGSDREETIDGVLYSGVDFPINPKELSSSKYKTRHVDLNMMTPEQRRGLHIFYYGLLDTNQKLSNGRRVERPIDAIRWLLEEINRATKHHGVTAADDRE